MKNTDEMSVEELKHEIFLLKNELELKQMRFEKIGFITAELLADYGINGQGISAQKALNYIQGVDNSQDAEKAATICLEFGRISTLMEIAYDYAAGNIGEQ